MCRQSVVVQVLGHLDSNFEAHRLDALQGRVNAPLVKILLADVRSALLQRKKLICFNEGSPPRATHLGCDQEYLVGGLHGLHGNERKRHPWEDVRVVALSGRVRDSILDNVRERAA